MTDGMLQLPLPTKAPPSLAELLTKQPLKINPPGWHIDVFPFSASSIFQERDESTLRNAKFDRRLVPDGKTYHACGVRDLLVSYSHLLFTEPGHEKLGKHFGQQLPEEEMTAIHENVALLLKNPKLHQSIDILLGLWTELGCDMIDKPLTKSTPLGTLIKSSCGIADALLNLAKEGGLNLTPDLAESCDDGVIASHIEVARVIRSLTTSCGSEKRGEFGTETPESTVLSLLGRDRIPRHGMEKLASSVKVSLTVLGGKTYHLIIPTTEVGLQQGFNLEVEIVGGDIVVKESSPSADEAKLFLAALSTILKRTVISNFDYRTNHPEIARKYNLIRQRVGYLDYIAMLAAKAVARVQENPTIPLTYPTMRTVGTADQKIGFQAENLHAPFKITKSAREVGNRTHYGQRVQVQGGPNACGKTYLWRRVLPLSRIAAGMGDLVCAKSCNYDPQCRVLVPLVPEWLNRSESGYLAFLAEINRGMRQTFTPADIIILDETGGVTANTIEHRRLKEFALNLANSGRTGIIITHSDSFINEMGENPPSTEIGVLNVSTQREKRGKRLTPTYLVSKGIPNWELYFEFAEQLAREHQ